MRTQVNVQETVTETVKKTARNLLTEFQTSGVSVGNTVSHSTQVQPSVLSTLFINTNLLKHLGGA